MTQTRQLTLNFQHNLQATLMVMQFGQFLDHDLTLTPECEAKDCCTEEAQYGRFEPECFPILFADTDPTFGNPNLGQNNFVAFAP